MPILEAKPPGYKKSHRPTPTALVESSGCGIIILPCSAPLGPDLPSSLPCPTVDTVTDCKSRSGIRGHRLLVEERRDDVEPTNNSSKLDRRPAVIHREVIGAFRSVWGAEASGIRSSILPTARKQGQNLFDAFLAVAGPSPLQAMPALSRVGAHIARGVQLRDL